MWEQVLKIHTILCMHKTINTHHPTFIKHVFSHIFSSLRECACLLLFFNFITWIKVHCVFLRNCILRQFFLVLTANANYVQTELYWKNEIAFHQINLNLIFGEKIGFFFNQLNIFWFAALCLVFAFQYNKQAETKTMKFASHTTFGIESTSYFAYWMHCIASLFSLLGSSVFTPIWIIMWTFSGVDACATLNKIKLIQPHNMLSCIWTFIFRLAFS